jgi:hypothetical protein
METRTSDPNRRDRRESTGGSASTEPPPAPPIDDGRFAVPWALPDEDDDPDR